MRILCIWLCLVSFVVAQDYEWYWITDFSGGLRTDLAPTILPDNYALELENAVIEGVSLRLRPGYSLWAQRIDSLTDGSTPAVVRGIRGLYEFYNDVSRETQVLAVVHDEVWWNDVDDSTNWHPIGLSGDYLILTNGDSLAQNRWPGDTWLGCIPPVDGDGWVLRAFDSTRIVHRIIGGVALLQVPWAGNTDTTKSYILSPTFDSIKSLSFETFDGRCFIADKTNPVCIWNGSQYGNTYFNPYPAIYATIIEEEEPYYRIKTNWGLGGYASFGADNYCFVHYDKVNHCLNYFPIIDCYEDNTSNRFWVLLDRLDYNALKAGGKVTTGLPLNEGFAFDLDTVFSGCVDSVLEWGGDATISDSILVHYGVVTFAADVGSLWVDVRDYDSEENMKFSDSLSYQVVTSCANSCTARVAIRINSDSSFVLTRGTTDCSGCAEEIIRWIAAGLAADTSAVNVPTYWEWGDGQPVGPHDDCGYGNDDCIGLDGEYNNTDSFQVALGLNSYDCQAGACGLRVTPVAADSFVVDSACNAFQEFHWITAGRPNLNEDRNEDEVFVSYGIDTIYDGWNHSNLCYFGGYYKTGDSFRVAFSYAETSDDKVKLYASGGSAFLFLRSGTSGNVILRWISCGVKKPSDTSLAYHVIYDWDEIHSDSITNDFDLSSAPHIFRLDNANAGSYFALGARASLIRDPIDSLGLRVLIPDKNLECASFSEPSIGDDYTVTKLTYFPSASYLQQRMDRLWFVGSPNYPNAAWYSVLNTPDDVSTIDYEVIGARDFDAVTGVAEMQSWLVFFKRYHIYALAGNKVTTFETYLKSGNYGLWSDGFLLPYMETVFGLNRMGMFAFNSASVTDHKQISPAVASFFTDSLNLAEIDLVRGELYNDYILFSFPSGTGTQNDKTLVLDIRTGAWTTWSYAAASYLTRRSPNGLDSLLWGSPDSTSIFVVGGTNDAGTEIELSYKSPYLDFGAPDWKKQVRKLGVICQANALCSLYVALYADDLQTAEYQDTIVCSETLGYNSPQTLVLDLPQSIESTTNFSVKIVSINADSLKISAVGFDRCKTRQVGAQ